jgi:hypothetical protein
MRGQLFKFGIILKNWTIRLVSGVKAGGLESDAEMRGA